MMGKQVFNYNKPSIGEYNYNYYGFHFKNGRFHIDTKRLKKLHVDGYFPEELFTTPRNTHYFVAKCKKKSDYKLYSLISTINRLSSDWKNEYKLAIDKIKTPDDVFVESRLNQIQYESDMDCIDEIEVEARMASYKRMVKYEEVIKCIHLQYLQRIFIEYFRSLNVMLRKDPKYNDGDDFTYGKLCGYVQYNFSTSKKRNPIYTLKHYPYFEAINKIDNFLKHNTIKSYLSLANNPMEKDEDLKNFLSSFVYSEKEYGRKFTNGEFAGNWLKITPDTIDDFLQNLREFSIELCKLLYNENPHDLEWNSDEALKEILVENCFENY